MYRQRNFSIADSIDLKKTSLHIPANSHRYSLQTMELKLNLLKQAYEDTHKLSDMKKYYREIITDLDVISYGWDHERDIAMDFKIINKNILNLIGGLL